METEKSLIDLIQTRLDSGEVKLPVFNATALRIQKEIASKDPDVQLIEKLIINDQALTGAVLKVANSALYKGLTQVATIKNAIIRLGINEVSNLVTLVTHENNFRSKDPFIHSIMRALWRHSLGCAIGAHWLAKHCGVHGISHEVFIAGLLHDVGKLFILKVIDEIMHSGKISIQISESLVNEAMFSLHTDCGYSLMQKWNLPEKFCRVAREHHTEAFDSKDFLLIIIRLANLTCNKMGIGPCGDASIVLMATPEAYLLQLSEIDLAQLEIKLEDSQVLGNQG